ncbi:MAG: ATP-binding protein [Anaerolineae bacterium]|jgi:signal transduction histidine kinase/CheY-like chemotaxis protein
MAETIQTDEIRQSFREEAEDLLKTLTGLVSLWLLLSSFMGAFLFPIYARRAPEVAFWVLAVLTLVGGASYLLHHRWAAVARYLLAVAPMACLAWFLQLDIWPPAAYVAPLLTLSAFVLGVGPGAVSLALGTATVALVPLAGPDRMLALVLLWLTACVAWLSMRGFHLALVWSHNSQMRALQLLSELRAQRGALNRTLKGLTEATEHLERLNHELAVARREAEEARSLKEQFVANVSHELRTPLNLVVGFAEMLYLDPEGYEGVRWTPDLVSDIGELFRAAQHLQSLVNDILDLSRIDAARLPMFREMTSLPSVVSEALETMAPLLRQHGLTYALACEDGLPEVFVDRTRIRQVTLNLLNNAVRFTRQGGVRLSIERTDESLVVHVADTGVGIPADQLESLFQRFQQAEAGVRSGGGAGLGLAISKQFVELHGGRIWADSVEGQGSTFSFAIPLPGTSVAYTGLRLTGAPEPKRGAKSPVVVVDQDPGIADILRRYLGDRPVVTVPDMDEVDAQIEAHHPVMLVVNRPPDADPASWVDIPPGAAERYALPVVRCSIPSGAWMREADSIDDCVSKPISLDMLRRVLGDEPPASVLVVDDDRGFVSLIRRMLRALDYGGRVMMAYNGEDAVELARSFEPELILLDLVLPGIDGFGVASACRRLDGETPRIVAVTATSYASEFLQRRGSRITLTRAGGISTGRVVEFLSLIPELVTPDYVSVESAASKA